MQIKSLFCVECRRYRRFERARASLGWGCVLSLCTCGLVFPVVCLMVMAQAFGRYRCAACGREYEGPLNPIESVERRRWARAMAKIDDDDDDDDGPEVGPEPGRGLVVIDDVDRAAAVAPWLDRMRAEARRAWAGIVEGYRALPDWAAPIVWGCGAALPLCVGLAVLWVYRHR